MKAYIFYLALCSLTHAVYISRMSTNRLRSPTPFRPGLTMQRPWIQPQTRLVQAASNRAPYVLYRNPSHRYAVKQHHPTRNMFAGGPWTTTGRQPPLAPSNFEYEFLKAASAQPVVHTDGGTGAIHTIPAPNLSLSEKPIVVIDASDIPVSEHLKPSYEVTEKYQEPEMTKVKIETPAGFSKATSLTAPELQSLIRNGAALQVGAEFGLPINMPQPQFIQPHPYPVQTFNALPSQQDLLNTRAEGIFIPPNALYQQDPMFLQKLQNHLLQRFPAVEFIPYSAESPQMQNINLQAQASQNHPQVIIVDDQNNRQVSEKNVFQRETQESTFVTIIPQSFKVPIASVEETTPQPLPRNLTLDILAAESQPVTTTIKYIIESNAEEQNTTPIYYAQVGQSVGNVIANGFYSAINDVRAAAALAQIEKSEANKVEIENITTTTAPVPDVQVYLHMKNEDITENKTDLKPILGVPFKKSEEPVNVAYTWLRTEDKEPKVSQAGAVYAGQIVEATVSEDIDYNKEKANLISRRAPIRLYATVDTNDSKVQSVTKPTQKVKVIKAKIPPKTKLTFDDKTGEPILRIYASYADNPAQKDAIIAKLTNMKHVKDISHDPEIWKTATVKAVDKSQGNDVNKVTQFGLKLMSRSDDYIPLFEEYDD